MRTKYHIRISYNRYSQSYGFSSSHAQMWELDHKEGWAPKNWCFWIVMLEKILESPLDCKEIKPVNPKGNQSWIFIGRTDAEAAILWPLGLIGKDLNARKDSRQKEKRTAEKEMVRAPPTQCTWIWANSRRQEKTEEHGMLQSMGSQSQTQLDAWTTGACNRTKKEILKVCPTKQICNTGFL